MPRFPGSPAGPSHPDKNPPDIVVNPFLCLLYLDSTFKYKIIPPRSAPTAFGLSGSRFDATSLGEEPKWQMYLRVKREYKCNCISAPAGTEDQYDDDDQEIDPDQVEPECDDEGWRTMIDHTTEVVGVCSDPQNPRYVSPAGLREKACLCSVCTQCDYICEDVRASLPAIIGAADGENGDARTAAGLADECGCRSNGSWGTHETTQDTIVSTRTSDKCFSCIMDNLGCGAEGEEAQSRIALIMTNLLKDSRNSDYTAYTICEKDPAGIMSPTDRAYGCFPKEGCPEMRGFSNITRQDPRAMECVGLDADFGGGWGSNAAAWGVGP